MGHEIDRDEQEARADGDHGETLKAPEVLPCAAPVLTASITRAAETITPVVLSVQNNRARAKCR